MKCPVCKTPDLMMTDRQGIEIDYCPQCRGVWLDRGEIDKIIERSAPQASAPSPQPQPQPQQQYAPQPQPYVNGHAPKYGHGDSHGYKQHHKKSFLQELFD